MKVIFLDVDGVLNYAFCEEKSPEGFIGVDDRCISVLATIVNKSDASIVLTSTWKIGWHKNGDGFSKETKGEDYKYLCDALNRHGIHIDDRTCDDHGNRGWGINKWLMEHSGVTEWLVLDDDVFPDYGVYGIMPHLALTDFMHGGLKEEHIDKCLKILNVTEG